MQEDVLGLDVAVDDAVLVGVLQRVGDLASDTERIVDGKLLLALEPVAERFAVDERHHVEHGAVDGARVEEREDVRVLQIRGGLDLRQEAVGADDGGELVPEHLDRDVAIVLQSRAR